MPPLSPLAPKCFPGLPDIAGIQLATVATGQKYKHRDDFMMFLGDEDACFAGVFTKSSTAAAAVHVSKAGLAKGGARAILTNAGNANAFTGRAGEEAITAYQSVFAEALGLRQQQILIASTGVIGDPLDADSMISKSATLIEGIGKASWQDAAKAIMTTDTFAKGATKQLIIGDKRVTLNGIAKGSGMIAPDMATMLGYIGTDAAITADCLQHMLDEAVLPSFNAITVDSDTSTSDSVYLIATHHSGHAPIFDYKSAEAKLFTAALKEVMTDLAQQIVKDGEGASKFITINVTGSINDDEAKIVAMSIGNSPLVKTAIAGGDANWGRIVMAVGKSGAHADRDRLKIAIGGHPITQNGQRIDDFDERPITRHMAGQEIDIHVDLGLGTGAATIWTCDFTHGYISINADYRS